MCSYFVHYIFFLTVKNKLVMFKNKLLFMMYIGVFISKKLNADKTVK